MQVDLRGAGFHIGFEGGVLAARRLPIKADAADRLGIEPRIAVGVTQGFDQRAEARLRGRAGHRVHRRVDRIHARFDRGQHRRARNPRGVVRMEMDRQPDLLSQRLDQNPRRGGLQEAGHVLEAEDVATRPFQVFGQVDIVAERIFGTVGIENISGVTDRAFGEFAGFADVASIATRMFSTQLRQSKMRKTSMPGARRLTNEITNDIVGIVGVADAVGAAQQHLGQDVGNLLPQQREPLPRVFGEKPHRHVECRAAPAFERQ